MNFYNRLVLHPKDIDHTPASRTVLMTFLHEQKFLSDSWHYQGQDYHLIGDRFLSQIMFMGCAPSIEFEPDEDSELPANFVAIRVPEFLSQTVFIPGKDEFHYRCPSCKKTAAIIERQAVTVDSSFQCQYCAKNFFFHRCNWRHFAGLGKCFIEVMGIFPQEAIPSSSLLEQLKEFSGVGWDYFYISNV